VSVINPAQAHQFAKALLKRAKTDAIDAQTLAQLAATLQPNPWKPPPAIYEELRQRLQQREDLLRALTQERNRLDALRHRPSVIASVRERSERWIAWCEAEIATLDTELTALLDQAGEWQAAAERLRSVPGIGPITAGWLLVETLAFTTCATPQQAAAFAGLAPHPYESGTSIRRRGRIGQGAVHGERVGGAPQPAYQGVLRTAARGRQAGESRTVRCGAQTAAPVLGGGDTRGRLRSQLRAAYPLTPNTVPLAFFLGCIGLRNPRAYEGQKTQKTPGSLSRDSDVFGVTQV